VVRSLEHADGNFLVLSDAADKRWQNLRFGFGETRLGSGATIHSPPDPGAQLRTVPLQSNPLTITRAADGSGKNRRDRANLSTRSAGPLWFKDFVESVKLFLGYRVTVLAAGIIKDQVVASFVGGKTLLGLD
jgi:hypothetical protein